MSDNENKKIDELLEKVNKLTVLVSRQREESLDLSDRVDLLREKANEILKTIIEKAKEILDALGG